MIPFLAGVAVEVGDSGGAVLVRGIPAGVSSRSFGGLRGALVDRLEPVGDLRRGAAVAARQGALPSRISTPDSVATVEGSISITRT